MEKAGLGFTLITGDNPERQTRHRVRQGFCARNLPEDPNPERCSCRKRACSRLQRRDRPQAPPPRRGQAGFLQGSLDGSFRYEDDDGSSAWILAKEAQSRE